jgi:hypothetical protein
MGRGVGETREVDDAALVRIERRGSLAFVHAEQLAEAERSHKAALRLSRRA